MSMDRDVDTESLGSVTTIETISASVAPSEQKRHSIFFNWHLESFRKAPKRIGKLVDILNPYKINLSDDTYKVCYKPCIRRTFKPLGVIAKIFGLFPCYDLSFVEKLDQKKACWVHIADYMYTFLVCGIMTCGGILCIAKEPAIMRQMRCGDEVTDFYVISAIIYITILMGILSLFIFPKSWCSLLRYLDHFAHVDKILEFDGRYARYEHCFAKRLVIHMIIAIVSAIVLWTILLIVDVQDRDITEVQVDVWDWVLVPMITLAVIVHMIPTMLLIFFLNALRIRILQFNDKVKRKVTPITPSCFRCKSFLDYGKELDQQMIEIKSEELAFDLEKLRILHGEVTDLVAETSKIFGAHLMRDFAFSITGVILYTYMLLFLRNDQGPYWSVYIFLDFFLVCKITFLCNYAERIKHDAGSLLKLFQKVSAIRLTKDCLIQIQMFIKKLDQPVVITANEYFVIDKRLLTTIMGSITTYFIILVQFKLTDYKSELMDLMDACNFTTFKKLQFIPQPLVTVEESASKWQW